MAELRKQSDILEIGGQFVKPGEAHKIAIPVSDLSAGMQAKLEVNVYHGRKTGPQIFISAAIHGDEIIGTEIIRQLMAKLWPGRLAGTVIFVPVVNMFGFINHSRYLPDRRDLNRSFPGSDKGSLAGQLANIFSREIIEHCTLGIDIHSAAVHRYNLPQIRIADNNPWLRDMALEFGAPAVIEAPLRPGSLRMLAKEAGVDMLLMETGEALRFDDFSVRTGVGGVLRVMRKLGMIQSRRLGKAVAQPAQATRTTWLRASRGGVCRLLVRSGESATKGEIVAQVSDIFGEGTVNVVSPVDGLIIGHSNLPVVNQGDAILHIAEVKRFNDVEDRVDKISDAIFSARILDEDEVI